MNVTESLRSVRLRRHLHIHLRAILRAYAMKAHLPQRLSGSKESSNTTEYRTHQQVLRQEPESTAPRNSLNVKRVTAPRRRRNDLNLTTLKDERRLQINEWV